MPPPSDDTFGSVAYNKLIGSGLSGLGLIPVMHRRDPRPQRSAFGVARSGGRGRFLCMTGISPRGGWSVPAEAARRDNCLELAQVEIADRSQCLRGRAVLKAVR